MIQHGQGVPWIAAAHVFQAGLEDLEMRLSCPQPMKAAANLLVGLKMIGLMMTGLVLTGLATSASAELRETTSPDALCSNGEQATYAYFDNGKSNDWLVYIHGGGVAANADQYRSRPMGMKSPAQNDHIGVMLTTDFQKQGFNAIIIGYCTSDLYQGFHTHDIDGKTVYFHGRKIVENVIELHKDQLAGADRLPAGYSAGAIALGFNADLIAQFDDLCDRRQLLARCGSLRMRLSWTKGPWVNITKFVYGKLPDHCKGAHWGHCFPSRPQFTKHGIDKVFPIWNIGDRYARHGDQNKVKQGIISDIKHYGAGYSIDAEAKQIHGFEEWGHVMTANDLYEKQIDGVVLRQLIWNWIVGKGKTTHIDH